MSNLLGIPLIISAVFAGFFAFHAAAYYWWYSQNLASGTHKVKIRVYAWGSTCLALSMLASSAFYMGILLLAEVQLSVPAALGLVAGLVVTLTLILYFSKPKGEKLDKTAKRHAGKARNKQDEINGLWGEIDDLRSKLRKKSGELKDANAELAKLEKALSEKNAELAGLKEVLSKEESPTVSSPPQEKGKGGEPTLPEELLGLNASGWKFSKFRVKGKEYVKVRRTTARGKREEKSLGRLDDRMKEALRVAGIQLG
jgi:hypothetical protein